MGGAGLSDCPAKSPSHPWGSIKAAWDASAEQRNFWTTYCQQAALTVTLELGTELASESWTRTQKSGPFAQKTS